MELKIDAKALDELKARLGEVASKPVMQAYKRSIKRAIDSGALIGYRLFSEYTNGKIAKLKKKKVIQGISTDGDGKSIESISAGIVFKKKQLGVSAFGARQIRAGVKWGNNQISADAFSAPIPQDETSSTFFQRKRDQFAPTKSGRYAGRKAKYTGTRSTAGGPLFRQKLRKLMGYSPAVVVGNTENIKREVTVRTVEQFNKEFKNNLEYYLQQALSRAQGSDK